MMILCFLIFYASSQIPTEARVLPVQKRSAFYIANETACVVNSKVYYSGENIPTDNPCESCRCRPPGFSCVLHECEIKHGCKAIRREGECCPEYLCGCEHNGQLYHNGEEIKDPQNPCYKCHCQGNSIVCAFLDCIFRRDCPPRFVEGECCPYYSHCRPSSTTFKVSTALPQWNVTSFISTQNSPKVTEHSILRDVTTLFPSTTIFKEDTSVPDATEIPKVMLTQKPEENEKVESQEEIAAIEQNMETSHIISDEYDDHTHKTEIYSSDEEKTSELTTRDSLVLGTGQSEKSTVLQQTKDSLPEARSTQSSAEILEPKDEVPVKELSTEEEETKEESSSEEVAVKEEETEEESSSEEVAVKGEETEEESSSEEVAVKGEETEESSEEEKDDISDERRQEVGSEENVSSEENTEETSSEDYSPLQDQRNRSTEVNPPDNLPSGPYEESFQISQSAVPQTKYESATYRDDSENPYDLSTVAPTESIHHISTKQETEVPTENYSEFTTTLSSIETTERKSDLEYQKEATGSASSGMPDSTVERIVTTRMEEELFPELTTIIQTPGQAKLQTISVTNNMAAITVTEREYDNKDLSDMLDQTITTRVYDNLKQTAETTKYEHTIVTRIDEYSIPSSTSIASTIEDHPEITAVDSLDKQTGQTTYDSSATTISEKSAEITTLASTITSAESIKQSSEITPPSQENNKISTLEQATTEQDETTSSFAFSETTTENTPLNKEITPIGELFTSSPHVEEETIYNQYTSEIATTEVQAFEEYLREKHATPASTPNGQTTAEGIHWEEVTEGVSVQEQDVVSENQTQQSSETTTIKQIITEENHEQSEPTKTSINFEQDFQRETATEEGTTNGNIYDLSTAEKNSGNENQDAQSTTENVFPTENSATEIHKDKFTETITSSNQTETSTHEQSTVYTIHSEGHSEEQTTKNINISAYIASITLHPIHIIDTTKSHEHSLNTASSTLKDTEIYTKEPTTEFSANAKDATETHATLLLNTLPTSQKDSIDIGLLETLSADHITTETDSFEEKTKEKPAQTLGPYTDQETNKDLTTETVVSLINQEELQNISTEVVTESFLKDTEQNASLDREISTVSSKEVTTENNLEKSQFETEFSFSTVQSDNSSINKDETIEESRNTDGTINHSSIYIISEEPTNSPDKNSAMTQAFVDESTTGNPLKDSETTISHSDDGMTNQYLKSEGVTDSILRDTNEKTIYQIPLKIYR